MQMQYTRQNAHVLVSKVIKFLNRFNANNGISWRFVSMSLFRHSQRFSLSIILTCSNVYLCSALYTGSAYIKVPENSSIDYFRTKGNDLMILKHDAHGVEFPVNSRENKRRRKLEYVLIQLNDLQKELLFLAFLCTCFNY